MSKLSISQAWNETQATLKQNRKLFVAVAGFFVLLPTTVVSLLLPGGADMESMLAAASNPLFWVARIIEIVGWIALARLALQPPTSVGLAVTRSVKRLPQVVLCWLIAMLPVVTAITIAMVARTSGNAGLSSIGLVVLGLGIYVVLRFSLIVPVAAGEEGWAVQILQRSWALTKGNVLRILATILLLVIALLVGMIVAGVLVGILIGFGGADGGVFGLANMMMALMGGLVQAIFTLFLIPLFARIYAQLAGERL